MKWLIVTMCVSVLLLAGGSGAATSVRPNVVLKYGELARINNTEEACAAVRVGIKIGSAAKQTAPTIACSASKIGWPVIGSHVNLAMWVKGPNGEGVLLPALGRWIRFRGAPYLYIRELWHPKEWGSPVIRFVDDIALKNQLFRKAKAWIRMRIVPPWNAFAPEGAGFACSVGSTDGAWPTQKNTDVSCDQQQLVQNMNNLSIMFWAPWGPTDLRIFAQDTNPDCINSEGTRGCGPVVLYPPP